MDKTKILLEKFNMAKMRLSDVLSIPETDIVRDSAIQRFEITVDLSWKLLKAYLEEYEGVSIYSSPKEIFRQAYKRGVIQYDTKWLDIIDMRNLTSHTYNESLAIDIYEKLPETLNLFNHLTDNFKVE